MHVACVCHVRGMRVALSQFLCMQHTCVCVAARVQRICTVCAARKQIYVQHTSNISVRELVSGLVKYSLVEYVWSGQVV